MPSNLRQAERTISNHGRSVLIAVVAFAAFIPDLLGTTSNPVQAEETPETSQAIAEEAPAPDAEGLQLKEFLDIYKLAPEQILERIPKPRPPGMRTWLNRDRPGQGDSLKDISSMTFRWRDPGRLQQWSSHYGGEVGWPIRLLPQYLEMEVYPAEIDGDPELLKQQIDGDWIYRKGIPDDRMIVALESKLQRALRLRISVKFREVERDVVVVRGDYHYTPYPGRSKNEIEIYGKQVVPGGGGAGGGSGSFPQFLKWVGEWIERPVVSELKDAPKHSVGWSYNARSPATKQERLEDHDEALVLQHLKEQTGLTFTRERRTIRVMFVERPRSVR